MTTIETRDGRPVAFEHAVEMAEYLCALDFGLDLIDGEAVSYTHLTLPTILLV